MPVQLNPFIPSVLVGIILFTTSLPHVLLVPVIKGPMNLKNFCGILYVAAKRRAVPSFLQAKLNDLVYNKNLNALLHKHASELKQQTHKEPVSSLKLAVGFASVSAHIWDGLRHLRNVDMDSSVNTDFVGCSFFKILLLHAGRGIADIQRGPAT